MKKNSLKVMVAALAAVMVIGVAGIGIAKTSAGFKFTAKSDDVAVAAADFTAKVTADGNETILDHNTVTEQKLDLGTVGITKPILFDGNDETISKTVTIENTGAVTQNVAFSIAVEAADSSKSNDVAMAARMQLSMSAEKNISGMTQAVDFSNGSIQLAAGESVTVTISIVPTSVDLATPGADNEAINGAADISASLDITPVR